MTQIALCALILFNTAALYAGAGGYLGQFSQPIDPGLRAVLDFPPRLLPGMMWLAGAMLLNGLLAARLLLRERLPWRIAPVALFFINTAAIGFWLSSLVQAFDQGVWIESCYAQECLSVFHPRFYSVAEVRTLLDPSTIGLTITLLLNGFSAALAIHNRSWTAANHRR